MQQAVLRSDRTRLKKMRFSKISHYSEVFVLVAIYSSLCTEGQRRCKDGLLPVHSLARKNAHLSNTVELTCRNGYKLIGSKWRFCRAGRWSGLPAKCQDIDECSLEGQHYPCHPNADCINTIGSYYCVCLPGFRGNGMDCQMMASNLLKPSTDRCGVVFVKNNTNGAKKRFRRVVGGHRSYPGEWPWLASIEVKKKVRLPFFAGVLVKPGWVLTVASQLHLEMDSGSRMILPREIKVTLGEYDRSYSDRQEQKFGVKQILVHPKYNHERVAYDIALLRLDAVEKRNSYINQICLVGGRKARIFENKGHLATVAGWGTTIPVRIGQNPGHFSRYLREANLPLVNRRTCETSTTYGFHSNSMLCAGPIAASLSPCFGDHGAPLVIQDPYSKQWVLLGLYSWSEGCGRPEKYSYYTRVSKFRRWITSIIRSS